MNFTILFRVMTRPSVIANQVQLLLTLLLKFGTVEENRLPVMDVKLHRILMDRTSKNIQLDILKTDIWCQWEHRVCAVFASKQVC